jgi:hypothetical protein
VQLVDEQDDLALGLLHFLEHRLEPLLELAAELRAGDQRAHVERDDLLILQPLGHVAADDALARPSTMAVLPTPGSPISTGLFLVRRDKHLDHAANLLVAADHRIELARLRRQLGQIAAVFFERFVGRFGILRGHALAAAHLLQRNLGNITSPRPPRVK